MGEILHLAVIHRQMFVVVCLRFRTTLVFHKYLTAITPTWWWWWWYLPPSCISAGRSLSRLLQKQLRQEGGIDMERGGRRPGIEISTLKHL